METEYRPRLRDVRENRDRNHHQEKWGKRHERRQTRGRHPMRKRPRLKRQHVRLAQQAAKDIDLGANRMRSPKSRTDQRRGQHADRDRVETIGNLPAASRFFALEGCRGLRAVVVLLFCHGQPTMTRCQPSKMLVNTRSNKGIKKINEMVSTSRPTNIFSGSPMINTFICGIVRAIIAMEVSTSSVTIITGAASMALNTNSAPNCATT